MSRFNVNPETEDELVQRMNRLGLREQDLVEKFILGSGSGGQKVNKTSSCVYLLHVPSGVEVKCQRERSQARNRFFARRELCERLEAQREGIRSRRQQERERIRRQKRRRSRRATERMLANKHRQAEKKTLRRAPGAE